MVGGAVEFLLENLKQLQLHHADLISDDTKNQIQVLENNPCLFKQFLKDSTDQNRDVDEILKQVVKQILEVVYEAEDAVDDILSQAAEMGVEKYFKRVFDSPAKPVSVLQQIELIVAKIKGIYDHKQIDFSMLQTKRKSYARKEQKILHENKVSIWGKDYVLVGLEDEAGKLFHHLTEKTVGLDVICIGRHGRTWENNLRKTYFSL